MSSKFIPSTPTPQPKYEYQKLQYGFGMVRGSDTRVKAEESPKVDDSTPNRDSKNTNKRK